MQLNEELTLKKGLGDTWTFLSPDGINSITISWDEKLRRLGERKDHAVLKRLKPDVALEFAELVKTKASDQELMELIGAGTYSVGLCFKYLKTLGLIPNQTKNRWAKKRRKPRSADRRLISCVKLSG